MTTATTYPTFFIDHWLADLRRRGKSEHTLSAYRRALNHFVGWSEGAYGQPFDPAHVITRDVRDWKSYQQTVEKTAPATINQRLTAVTQFFAWATAQRHVRSDPTTEVKTLARPPRKPKALAETALRRLLRAVHADGNLRDIAMIELFVGTGLRVEELLTLQVDDLVLNPRSGYVKVRKSKHGNPRTVPLTAQVRNTLAAYLQSQSNGETAGVAVWWGERGPLRDRSAVNRLLTKYSRQAGIETLSPHTLRHTFATRYLKANPDDLRGLAALLGHSNINTVMIYTEPGLDDLVERMERMEVGG